MSIHQMWEKFKNGSPLLDIIPAGSDPTFWGPYLAGYDPAAKPKCKRRRAALSRKAGRNFQASAVLTRPSFAEQEEVRRGKAQGELVERHNNGKPNNASPRERPG